MGKEALFNDYLEKMGETLKKSPLVDLDIASDIFMQARSQGRWIFVAGNGGSSATASHMVNDFVKGLTQDGKKRFRMMALNDNIPTVTALANDYDYSDIFLEQLKNYAQEGDVFTFYSGSGNSINVVKAAKYAKELGMKVVGFTGRDGGEVTKYCTVNCIAPTDVMEEIEDVHMVWEHAFITILRKYILEEVSA